MIKDILNNIAFLYYPKEISATNNKESYLNSIEHKRLKRIILDFEKNTQIINLFIKELKSKYFRDTFRNLTSFDWLDRCYSFQVIKTVDNKALLFNIYISILIPYYSITLEEVEIDIKNSKWKSNLKLIEISNNQNLIEEYNYFKKLIEEYFSFSEFPNNLKREIIKEISFQDYKYNQMTFFNAFFK